MEVGRNGAGGDLSAVFIKEMGYANVRKDNAFLQQLTTP